MRNVETAEADVLCEGLDMTSRDPDQVSVEVLIGKMNSGNVELDSSFGIDTERDTDDKHLCNRETCFFNGPIRWLRNVH